MPFLLYIFISCLYLFHPSYVAVVEAEYLPKEKLMGISCKIFSDDLESTLKTFSGKEVDILKGEKKKNNDLLKRYFASHLSIVIDSHAYQPAYLGFENDNEATWVYLELKNINSPAHIDIITDLLYDFNKSQTNIVYFIINGVRKSHRLQFPEKKVSFSMADQ